MWRRGRIWKEFASRPEFLPTGTCFETVIVACFAIAPNVGPDSTTAQCNSVLRSHMGSDVSNKCECNVAISVHDPPSRSLIRRKTLFPIVLDWRQNR